MHVYKMFGKVLGGPNNNCSYKLLKSILIRKEKQTYMYLFLNDEEK